MTRETTDIVRNAVVSDCVVTQRLPTISRHVTNLAARRTIDDHADLPSGVFNRHRRRGC
jgi:hypothetical protein